MKVLRCVLNIGNTHTRVRVVSGSRVQSDECFDTPSFTPDKIPAGMPCAACCVVSSVEEMLRAARPDILFITKDTPGLPLFRGVDASTVGADRLANIAMLAAGPLPAMTVDCGTAINIEVVDRSCCFIGGAILPGRQMLRSALHQFTARLPEIPLEDELPEIFPGRDTRDALRFGTDSLVLAGVRDFISRTVQYMREAGITTTSGVRMRPEPQEKPLRVVVCGGDRDFFLKHLRPETIACEIQDDGMDYIWRGVLNQKRLRPETTAYEIQDGGMNYTLRGVLKLLDFRDKINSPEKNGTAFFKIISGRQD